MSRPEDQQEREQGGYGAAEKDVTGHTPPQEQPERPEHEGLTRASWRAAQWLVGSPADSASVQRATWPGAGEGAPESSRSSVSDWVASGATPRPDSQHRK